MSTLWVLPIEPIESRYTKHWYQFLPELLADNIKDASVVQIDLPFDNSSNTPGAFLNFGKTVDYKARQVSELSRLFGDGVVKAGDVFLFTDYWNPGVHFVKYMSVLLNIPVKIAGICHAGFWDPWDILGKQFSVNSSAWARAEELAMDAAYDVLFFTTEFSRSLYEVSYPENTDKNKIVGYPMGYYDKVLTPYWDLEEKPAKENIILFPHRKSIEKNPELFAELSRHFPDYKFVVSMDVCSNKDQYHDLLYRSKICLSLSLQETFGISMGVEALRAGCFCLVPDRLSYTEMFFDSFKYPGTIAANGGVHQSDVDSLVGYIQRAIDQVDNDPKGTEFVVKKQQEHIDAQFCRNPDFYLHLKNLLG